MVRVFFGKNTPLWSNLEEIEKLANLPEEFAQRIRSYQNIEDRQIRIRSKLLLLKSLQILGFPNELKDLKSNSFGKSFFVSGPYFNLSHSGNLVCCIISSECQVGIDTEVYGDKDVEEYLSFLSPENRVEIESSSNQSKAFLEYWTKFEASVKADGRGLFISMDQVQIRAEVAIVEGKKWYTMCVLLSEENTTSIASEMPIEVVELVEVVL
jgi:4'-phosphopantetheinyl transferase